MPLEYYCFSHALRNILLDSFNDNSYYACADADLYLKIDPPCRSLSKVDPPQTVYDLKVF